MEKATDPAVTQLPDWETRSDANHKPMKRAFPTLGGFSSSLSARYDKLLPPNRTYTPAKLKRKTFVLVLLALFVALLALILGLAIGLTQRNKGTSANLPLPNGAEVYHGDLTYYGPGLGACGITSSDSDNIVAVAHALFNSQSQGSNPNANPLCGRMLRAQRFDSRVGKTVSLDLKVVDRCKYLCVRASKGGLLTTNTGVGCQPTDLDVSPGAFNQLADPDLGRVHDMSWAWL